ncbi:chemotaxis protein CheX [Actinotalea sp. K2]|uniref:chemotaxis protein CheX n=1 Tax=Actinotalea sp. K2 TaxID=2939438 RepID=UPI0020178629|nr:chemotaxis protein CheX [Actinotalea sp. K2]MCL3860894.1 chemotaxis protein CheX [Actinotalea sp. K2]
MSMQVDTTAFAGTDPVYVIAEEVFSSMIDGEPGFLRHWDGDPPPIVDAMHAWVDVHGATNGRVLLSTERSTADDLARALLQMGPTEPVSDEDFADALGEVANIVGGNVKALVPDPGVLTLPQVTHERPHTDPEALIYELPLDWRGSLVVIGLWRLL